MRVNVTEQKNLDQPECYREIVSVPQEWTLLYKSSVMNTTTSNEINLGVPLMHVTLSAPALRQLMSLVSNANHAVVQEHHTDINSSLKQNSQEDQHVTNPLISKTKNTIKWLEYLSSGTSNESGEDIIDDAKLAILTRKVQL